MQYTVAQRVKGILVSSGHNNKERAAGDRLPSREETEAARRAYDEMGRIGVMKIQIGSGDYFTVDPEGEGALLKYRGSALREEERLRLYRLAVENCGFLVTEEDDAERPGRRALRVVRG